MTNYQDFDYVNEAINIRANIETVEAEQMLTHYVLDILRIVDCQNKDIFDTVINGICNAFLEGINEEQKVSHMWKD